MAACAVHSACGSGRSGISAGPTAAHGGATGCCPSVEYGVHGNSARLAETCAALKEAPRGCRAALPRSPSSCRPRVHAHGMQHGTADGLPAAAAARVRARVDAAATVAELKAALSECVRSAVDAAGGDCRGGPAALHRTVEWTAHRAGGGAGSTPSGRSSSSPCVMLPSAALAHVPPGLLAAACAACARVYSRGDALPGRARARVRSNARALLVRLLRETASSAAASVDADQAGVVLCSMRGVGAQLLPGARLDAAQTAGSSAAVEAVAAAAAAAVAQLAARSAPAAGLPMQRIAPHPADAAPPRTAAVALHERGRLGGSSCAGEASPPSARRAAGLSALDLVLRMSTDELLALLASRSVLLNRLVQVRGAEARGRCGCGCAARGQWAGAGAGARRGGKGLVRVPGARAKGR
eukprot:366019-Chlamydomonas_euryale.AAC.7